jgi:hypothetical protein
MILKQLERVRSSKSEKNSTIILGMMLLLVRSQGVSKLYVVLPRPTTRVTVKIPHALEAWIQLHVSNGSSCYKKPI